MEIIRNEPKLNEMIAKYVLRGEALKRQIAECKTLNEEKELTAQKEFNDGLLSFLTRIASGQINVRR